MDKRLKSSDEDNERVRVERDGLRARLLELQTNLEEKEGEVRREAEDRRLWVINIMINSIVNHFEANYNSLFLLLLTFMSQ